MLNKVVGHLGLGPRDANRVPKPCHRLDLETSGVLIFAKTAEAATATMKQFEERSVQKVYIALTTARPNATRVDAAICKVAGAEHCERRPCMPGEKGGQEAYSFLAVYGATADRNGPCMVVVKPKQGRTHQVRVHCAAAVPA